MEYNDILEGHSPDLVAIANYLKNLILSFNSKIKEDIYGGKTVKMASYSIARPTNVIAVLGLGKDHCKLFLHHVDKIDSNGLNLEGKGKHAKHIKIFRLQDINELIYRKVIGQVVEIVESKA